MNQNQLSTEKILNVVYTNWRGETQKRSIVPVEIIWGSTEWHPQEQWLLKCWDIDRNDYRLYALKDIKEIL